jgi:hypothetical protein
MYCQFLGGKKTIICTKNHLRLEKDLKKVLFNTNHVTFEPEK